MINQSVIVTGAASGIGRACAERLISAGNRVAAVDIQPIACLQASADAIAVGCDVSSTQDCQTAVQQSVSFFGGLDALVHCAAIHSSANWEQLEAGELFRVLDVNIVGSLLIAKAAAQAMRPHGSGAIVLTSSSNIIGGGVGGAAGLGGPAYVASKAPIVGLVRSLAKFVRAIRGAGQRHRPRRHGYADDPQLHSGAQSRAAGALAVGADRTSRRDRRCLPVPGIRGRPLHDRRDVHRQWRGQLRTTVWPFFRPCDLSHLRRGCPCSSSRRPDQAPASRHIVRARRADWRRRPCSRG